VTKVRTLPDWVNKDTTAVDDIKKAFEKIVGTQGGDWQIAQLYLQSALLKLGEDVPRLGRAGKTASLHNGAIFP
jgi:hypothetical protein